MKKNNKVDVVVIGGGMQAARLLFFSRMGVKTLLITQDPKKMVKCLVILQ